MPPLALAASRILLQDSPRLVAFQRFERAKNRGSRLHCPSHLLTVAPGLHPIGDETPEPVPQTASRKSTVQRFAVHWLQRGGAGARSGACLRRGPLRLRPAKIVENAFDR